MTTEIKITAGYDRDGMSQAKAATIVRIGGRVTLTDGELEVDVQNAQWGNLDRLHRPEPDNITLNWASPGGVDLAGATAMRDIMNKAVAVAEEASRCDNPFTEVPLWVGQELADLDYDEDRVLYRAIEAYKSGLFNHHEAWEQAIEDIEKEGGI